MKRIFKILLLVCLSLAIFSSASASQFSSGSVLATEPFPLLFEIQLSEEERTSEVSFLVFNGFDLFEPAPLEWEVSSEAEWVTPAPTSGTIRKAGEEHGTNVDLRIDASDLPKGNHKAAFRIVSNATVSPSALEGEVVVSVGTGGVSQPSIESLLDSNNNHTIDDDEILRAVEWWIKGDVVPGFNSTIEDSKIVDLITIWIKGERVA